MGIAGVDAKPDHRRLEPRNLTGTYSLHYIQGSASVATMKIWGQVGSTFLVGAAKPTGRPELDWDGRGFIDGDRGYYDWTFRDGKKGRTTFFIDREGNLHGQVRGAGLDWNYIGRRVREAEKAPPKK
jgi:hypothetical protein